MIPKWKTPGTITPIGNKIILYLAVAAVVCNLYACNLFSWDCYGPEIAVKIENQTQDTLEILINIHRFDTITLLPKSLHLTVLGVDICGEEEDPVRDGLFAEQFPSIAADTVRLFLKDSLLTEWHGPPREIGLDNNHFFNYCSWKHIDEPDTSFFRGGALVFTVSESDFGHIDE